MWLSYFMDGRRSTKLRPLFAEKFLYVKKDVQIETDDEIILWTRDYKTFEVYTRWRDQEGDRFSAPPGRDAMYGALAIFFWFVREKLKMLLDGADLTEAPILMDRVFELAPFA